jgi:hypothetical protein
MKDHLISLFGQRIEDASEGEKITGITKAGSL